MQLNVQSVVDNQILKQVIREQARLKVVQQQKNLAVTHDVRQVR